MDMSLFSSDCDRHSNDPDEDVDQSVDLISHGFNQQLDLHVDDDDSSSQLLQDSEEVHVDQEDNDHDDDDDDDDFTFMLIGNDEEHIYEDEVFEDGKIRPVFPLFDRNLLVEDEYDIDEINHTLPILPPVDKIFIESPRGFPSSTKSEHEPNNDAATGPFCSWSKDSPATTTAELNKKSNSTGFSKLWRLKEKVGRSNSDGRDAFVFLKSCDNKTTTATTSSSSKPVNGTFVKVNNVAGRGVKQGTKTNKAAKKPTVSAHGAYLRSKGHTEEERRRSYLPYRPELMGIFTNAHVGLSKNVHPY